PCSLIIVSGKAFWRAFGMPKTLPTRPVRALLRKLPGSAAGPANGPPKIAFIPREARLGSNPEILPIAGDVGAPERLEPAPPPSIHGIAPPPPPRSHGSAGP